MAELFKPELESILPNWTKGAPKHVKAFSPAAPAGFQAVRTAARTASWGSISRSIRATLSPA